MEEKVIIEEEVVHYPDLIISGFGNTLNEIKFGLIVMKNGNQVWITESDVTATHIGKIERSMIEPILSKMKELIHVTEKEVGYCTYRIQFQG
jgi:hypothetical protein